jgi:hypothetical protein
MTAAIDLTVVMDITVVVGVIVVIDDNGINTRLQGHTSFMTVLAS